MTTYIQIPEEGQPISLNGDQLSVPNQPIIPYIVGDGIGEDITPTMLNVVNAAVKIAYGGDKKIAWLKTLAGQQALSHYDGDTWLPEETIEAFSRYKVGIKGPLDAPLGSGMQSLSIQIREELSLNNVNYAFQSFEGIPSLLTNSQLIHIDVFQESEQSLRNHKLSKNHQEAFNLPGDVQANITLLSRSSFEGLLNSAITHAFNNNKPSITFVHQGGKNPEFDNALRKWAYEFVTEKHGASIIGHGPWMTIKNPISGAEVIIKDIGMDAMLQQALLTPAEYSVVVAPSSYGSLLSSALAAQTGTVGLAPVTYSSDQVSIFEASHGTAKKYAGLNKVNPCSILLTAEQMLRHIGWDKAANLIIKGIRGAISAKTVTYDLANKMEGSTLVTCSQFGDCIIEKMGS